MTTTMLKWLCAAAVAISGGSALAQGAGDVETDPGMQPPGGGSTTPGQMGTQGAGKTGQQGQLGQQAQMQGQHVRLSSLNKEEIKQVQQALQQQGIYQGPIDGVAGPETYAAVGAFQQKQGGRVSGHLDQQTAQALGVSFGDIQPVRGGDEPEPMQQPQPLPGGGTEGGGSIEQPGSGSTGGGATTGGSEGSTGGGSTGGGGQ